MMGGKPVSVTITLPESIEQQLEDEWVVLQTGGCG
jgi:hypothetical protein